MEIKKIVVLGGGFSEEKEISRVSSAEISAELAKNINEVITLDPSDFTNWSAFIAELCRINPDIVFVGLHGAEGEDGRLQSLLSLHDIPFTGSDNTASALAMDKEISGILAQSSGCLLPKRIILNNVDDINQKEIVEQLGLPLVVKPNSSGSSVGISIVSEPWKLNAAIIDAFNYSDRVICEKFIAGRELTVTILGKQPLPVVEIIPNTGWYDYANKYTKGNTIYEVPAKLSDDNIAKIQDQALKVFQLFGCRGYARVDFRYDGKEFYFLEINTLPGMTPLSLTPMAAKEYGLSFSQLLMRIIEESL